MYLRMNMVSARSTSPRSASFEPSIRILNEASGLRIIPSYLSSAPKRRDRCWLSESTLPGRILF
jgi:hypothetical protein